MKIHIRNDERVIFAGRTGSGKTVLAKHLLKRLNRVIVIDPKHTFRLEGYEIRRSLPAQGSDFRIIYRPRMQDDDGLALVLSQAMRGKYVTIYVDELATLAEMFPVSTVVLQDIARTGRERHVAIWAATQRPRGVPKVFFTEAEVVFLFDLRWEDDRKHIAQFIGPEAEEEIERYTFWYYTTEDSEPPALMRLDMGKNYIEKIG